MDKNWKEIMDMAEKHGFVVWTVCGIAILATHYEQKKQLGQEKYERIQKMNRRTGEE
jgi:PP-loop superfamily ATP-utilizing enzyme